MSTREGMGIEIIHHVSLCVTSLQRSKAFYGEVLGLQEIRRPPFDFPGAWYQVGGGQLHLLVHDRPTLRGSKPVDSRDNHFALRVTSIRRALDLLHSKGYREDAGADDLKRMKVSLEATAGFPQIHIVDPDHHVIEINSEKLE